MEDKSGKDSLSKIKRFWQSEKALPSAIREILSVLVTVGVIVAVLYLICGTWPAIVTIESGSMIPNMNIGDLVLVMAPDRLGQIQTMDDGNKSGYVKFGKPGDVIIYRPNGIVNYPREVLEPGVQENFLTNLSWDIRTFIGWNQVHPIIHRALIYKEEGDSYPYSLSNGYHSVYIPPSSGYLTKGDNQETNYKFDQIGFGNNYRGLGSGIQPVKPEWIVGKAIFAIPLIGILPLHIKEVIILVVILMILHEIYLRTRKSEENDEKMNKKNKKSIKNK